MGGILYFSRRAAGGLPVTFVAGLSAPGWGQSAARYTKHPISLPTFAVHNGGTGDWGDGATVKTGFLPSTQYSSPPKPRIP